MKITSLGVIESALVGKRLFSIGRKKFKNAKITEVHLRGHDDPQFGETVSIDVHLECEDRIGRKSRRAICCDIEDELELG